MHIRQIVIIFVLLGIVFSRSLKIKKQQENDIGINKQIADQVKLNQKDKQGIKNNQFVSNIGEIFDGFSQNFDTNQNQEDQNKQQKLQGFGQFINQKIDSLSQVRKNIQIQNRLNDLKNNNKSQFQEKNQEQEREIIDIQNSGMKIQPTILAESQLDNFNNYDTQYSGNFYVGTPFQEFLLVFDTGSSVLWFPSNECSDCNYAQNLLQIEASSTIQISSDSYSIQYGSGSCQGNLARDYVSLDKNVKVIDQFLLAYFVEGFSDGGPDGIMGLSNVKSYNNILDIAAKEGKISSPTFAFEIKKSVDGESYFYFDDIPQQYLNFEVELGTTQSSYWSFKNTQISVGDTTIKQQKMNALVDSGTSLLIFSYTMLVNIVREIYYQAGVPFKNDLTFPCSEISKFPTIQFYTQTHIFVLTAQDYTYDNLYTDGLTCLIGMHYLDGLGENGMPDIILGDVFMRNYVVTFNKQKQSMGFVQASGKTGRIQELEQATLNWLLIFGIIAGIIIICVVIFIIYQGQQVKEKQELQSTLLQQTPQQNYNQPQQY